MQVRLASVGNPDKGQDPGQRLSPIKIVEVGGLQEATQECRKYIDQYCLGSGNWDGGEVFENGKQTAQISYNGRVWDKNGKEIVIT